MKNLLYVLLISAILLTGCQTTGGNIQEVDDNFEELIINGDVSNGTEKWGLYVNPPGKGIIIDSEGQVEYIVDKVGKDKWHIQGYYAGLTFIKGASYKVKFDMSSTIPRDAQMRIQLDSDPYTGYIEEDIKLTTDMTTYEFEFVMEYESDEFAKLCFNIGMFPDSTKEPHSVNVDNLSILVDKRTIMKSEKAADVPVIAINQIGYLPLGIKEVRINSESTGFNIKNISSDDVLYSGTFNSPIDDPASGEMVYVGDFTDFNTEGEYIIEVVGIGNSHAFEIKDNLYKPLYDAVEKVFYYQRCGEELTADKAGIWAHGACHLEEATIYGTNKKIDVSGGWHDAGDYGRYVGPGAKAVADLILSNNLTPELLAEIRYELDWMLKMQDSETGGVYHKVTTPAFIGSIMPDTDSTELIVSPISSAATADFAAVMALASRISKDYDSEFSKTSFNAALKAWSWLEKNKDIVEFLNPDGITTGEYGDTQDGDERYWAAIELFLTTGSEKYHAYAQNSFMSNNWDGLGWQAVGTYGTISYIFSDFDKKNDDFNDLLTSSFLEAAKVISDNTLADGYGISLGMNYEWGSNELVADNGMRLLLAEKLTGSKLYKKQAEQHLHYLLGSNSLGQSYVSGFGDLTIENPHHRPTNAAGSATPGMLAGGPNKGLQDPLAKSKLDGLPPQKCFIDAEPSYSTNEMTIYWNSPLYVLLTSFVHQ